VKFLSRLFTALNLLPSMATLAVAREAHLAAEFDEARTYPAQRPAIVFAEVRDRLVIRREPTQQPHDFDIASGLAFKPPARLHPVQIALNVKLKENRGVVRWSTSRRRLRSLKAHLSQIERINKYVDHPNRVALVNEIIEAFGQQRPLPTIACLTKRFISFPRRITRESAK
jgi:hypothetical protein